MSALTKIFIVLQLICALVAAVVLVGMAKNQTNYRANSESDHATMLMAQGALAQKAGDLAVATDKITQLTQANITSGKENERSLNEEKDKRVSAEIERDQYKASIATAENKVTMLTAAQESLSKEIARQNAEIARLAPENVKLIQQNAELSRANNEAVTALHFAEQSIRKLQEALVAAESKSGAGTVTQSDSGAVASLSAQAPAQVNGKVTDAKQSGGRTLLEISLGSRDGLAVGTKLVISRGGNFVADAKVTKVTPDSSIAAAEPLQIKQGETVKAGDIVTSGKAQ